MQCDMYNIQCEGKDCIDCDSNICDEADDCAEFSPESCIGAGIQKCDAYISLDEIDDMMHPNETFEEFMEYENFD